MAAASWLRASAMARRQSFFSAVLSLEKAREAVFACFASCSICSLKSISQLTRNRREVEVEKAAQQWLPRMSAGRDARQHGRRGRLPLQYAKWLLSGPQED